MITNLMDISLSQLLLGGGISRGPRAVILDQLQGMQLAMQFFHTMSTQLESRVTAPQEASARHAAPSWNVSTKLS